MSGAARAGFWGALAIVLALSPLPTGCVDPEWRLALALACLLPGAAAAVGAPLLARRLPRMQLTLVPFAAFTAWVLVAAVPLPRGLVAFLSPGRAAAPPLPDGGGWIPLSEYAGGTIERGLLYLGVFYLLWALSESRSRAPLRILAATGSAHAVFAVVLLLTGGTSDRRVLWVYQLSDVLTPFGTYVNKNHFAGLMLVSGGAALAVLLRRFRRIRVAGGSPRRIVRLALPAAGLAAILLVTAGSGSRGAALALLAGALAGAVASFAAGNRRASRCLAALAGAIVLAAIVAVAGPGTSAAERAELTGRWKNRPRLWKDVLVMTAAHPVAGTGEGSFRYVSPRYQSFDDEREFVHAEGDWIQFLAETGIVGFLLMALFCGSVVRRTLRLVRGRGSTGMLAAGALVGLFSVLFHGFVDTSLHIPANLVAAAVLVGGVVMPRVEAGKGEHR
jgi:O-antigen ligase